MTLEKTSIIALTISSTLSFATASELPERVGFFWGAGLGGGYVERTFSTTNGFDDATARLYMEFFGGYAFNPHVAVGLEIGGWLIEPDSDVYVWNPYWPPDNQPSEEPTGEGLEQILLFTRLYPYAERGLFIKLGGGYMNHWLKTSRGRYDENGWTSVAGLGWDFHVSGKWSVTPTISYSYGVAGRQTHQAITASFGFMWHQWKGPDLFSQEDFTAPRESRDFNTYLASVKHRFTPARLQSKQQDHDFY